MTRTDRPNVLLVVLDSVRAANTSLHGHEHETTPFLEEFAEEATVYEQARSPGTWSLPSHTSIFTGYHVVEHGVTRARHELEPEHTIFEELAEGHDYATGVFSENTWITDMPVGLKDAFDTIEGARNLPFPDAVDPSNFVLSEGQGHYVEYLKHCLSREDTLKSLANGVFTKLAWDYPRLLPDRFQSSTPAGVYGDLFLDWEAEQSEPWAACVNFMDGHLPYLPDEEYDQWGGTKLRKLQDEMDDQVWEFNGGQRPWWQRKALEGLYDGTIRQMDAELERIVGALRDQGALDDTLLVITSDHGEGFGEPSRIRPGARVAAHGAGIHEVLTHVPLVVRYPDTESDRVEETASLTEFPGVVRSALAGDLGTDAFVPDGPVLVSSHGLEEPMEERALRYTGDLHRFNGDCRAIYTGGGHDVTKSLSWREKQATIRVHTPTASYKTHDDDESAVDEAFGQFPDLDIRLEHESTDIDSATEERLKDLGYM
jgi:arylsulfatase A-like enzyme